MVIIKKRQKVKFWISINLLAKLQSLQRLQSAKDVTLGSEGHIKVAEILTGGTTSILKSRSYCQIGLNSTIIGGQDYE